MSANALQVYDTRREHVLALARVSRSLNVVATCFIYRSVTYRAYPDGYHKKKTDSNLLHRLSHNHRLKAYVRSFTVGGSPTKLKFSREEYVVKLEPIAGLVSVLPHLEIFA